MNVALLGNLPSELPVEPRDYPEPFLRSLVDEKKSLDLYKVLA